MVATRATGPSPSETFADLITAQKQRLHFTDQDLARRMVTPGKPKGISPTAIGQWRNGATPTHVPPETIAAAIEVPVEVVLTAMGLHPLADTQDPRPAATSTRLTDVLARIAEPDLAHLVEFAEFLAAKAERKEWQDYALARLAQAYGDDEPEYTTNDLLP